MCYFLYLIIYFSFTYMHSSAGEIVFLMLNYVALVITILFPLVMLQDMSYCIMNEFFVIWNVALTIIRYPVTEYCSKYNFSKLLFHQLLILTWQTRITLLLSHLLLGRIMQLLRKYWQCCFKIEKLNYLSCRWPLLFNWLSAP